LRRRRIDDMKPRVLFGTIVCDVENIKLRAESVGSMEYGYCASDVEGYAQPAFQTEN
jgi:hypothetical protein